MVKGLSFGAALEAVKNGKKVSRERWKMPGHFINMINVNGAKHIVHNYNNRNDNNYVAGDSDLLANDWYIVEDLQTNNTTSRNKVSSKPVYEEKVEYLNVPIALLFDAFFK